MERMREIRPAEVIEFFLNILFFERYVQQYHDNASNNEDNLIKFSKIVSDFIVNKMIYKICNKCNIFHFMRLFDPSKIRKLEKITC